MPRTSASVSSPVGTAPVLAVLVCHNGQRWLPDVLAALPDCTVRPRHVLAVDTGSTDDTPELLVRAREDGVVDGVLTLPEDTGYAAAVTAAVDTGLDRWGDPGSWLWLLHDDSAPDPDCLDLLLRAADTASSAAMLGPLAVDWSDPRVVVESGLSTDGSGHRRQLDTRRLGDGTPEQTTEVLAVPSAGALISRAAWDDLGGFDTDIPLLREDLDFGWRANASGRVVLCVPRARVRHARAVTTRQRSSHAGGAPVAVVERVHGARTVLVNRGTPGFLLGLAALPALCLLRMLVFAVLRDGERARAELAAVRVVAGGAGALRGARARRLYRGSLPGLFTGTVDRCRAGVRRLLIRLVRVNAADDGTDASARVDPADPGEDPDGSGWVTPEQRYRRAVTTGPDSLPAGAGLVRGRSAATGLRRPTAGTEAPDHSVDPDSPEDHDDTADRTGPGDPAGAEEAGGASGRPSPGPRAGTPHPASVELDRRRVLAATVFAPPVVLAVVLTAVALVTHAGRLGLDPAGGALLPVGDLGQVWSAYLDAWHGVSGGTAGAAPVALAVLGLLGAPLVPLGGPPAAVALLLLADIPLAALTAYGATRSVPVSRWVRAALAAGYGLLPPATAGVAQGRLDVVVVHVLLPAVLAGIVAVLRRPGTRWLHRSVLTGLGLAVSAAFYPSASLLLTAGLLVGFVVLSPPDGRAPRRALAVAVAALLPMALLLPWLPTLVTRPGAVLHGLGGPAGGVSPPGLAGLDPGGPGALPLGAVVLVVAVVAAVVRPGRHVLPGLALATLGGVGVVAVSAVRVEPLSGGPPAPGFPGVPLLFVGAGALAVVLAALRPRTEPMTSRAAQGSGQVAKVVAVATAATVLTLAVGGVLAGRAGPLTADGGTRLNPSVRAELADTGRGVLVLDDVVRHTAGRAPRFGDDAIVAAAGGTRWLETIRDGLLAGSPDAVTRAAAAGVGVVVLPPGENGAALRAAGPDLVAPAPPTADGRAAVRLTPVSAPVTLISPEQAGRALSGQAPDAGLMRRPASAPVDAEPPGVAVRVSDGPQGRLLVLASRYQAGWSATVDGEPVPIQSVWSGQVGVSVPARESEVTVSHDPTPHDLLLLGQVAALLFTVFTSVPSRRAP